jgi:2-iminobutanoate/2-iminopropanoate deaminase
MYNKESIMKKQIITDKAPGAIGPYSQGIKHGNMVFTSGQLPINAEGNVPETIEEQTTISLENVREVLAAAGLGLHNVVKTTVYLNDIKEFPKMNNIYKDFFEAPFPARSAFEVAELPLGVKVEIEVIAIEN